MAASHRHLHRCLAGYFLLTGRCHSVSAAPGSGVCREARSGTCVRYAEETTRRAQTTEMCADANQGRIDNCKMGKCNVAIGRSQCCSQCSAAAEYLIDGACVTDGGQRGCAPQNTPDGTCTSCNNGYFLRRGECYKKRQTPGNAVCIGADAGAAGVCEACTSGYFKNPGNIAILNSRIACDDTEGVAVNGARSKGIANCVVCTAPAKADGGERVATYTAGESGYFANSNRAAYLNAQIHVQLALLLVRMNAHRARQTLAHASRKVMIKQENV